MRTNLFEVDEQTQAKLEELKEFFGVDSSAAALKRAIALADIASQNTDEKKQLTIINTKDKKEKIVRLGR